MKHLEQARAFALAAAVALAGCDDAADVTDPAVPALPRLSAASVPAVAGDATALIRQMVGQYDTLYFGDGEWMVKDATILLDRNTVIIGLGGTRSTIYYENVGYENFGKGWDSPLFLVDHTGGNVVVDGMHFRGTASRHQFALKVHGGRNVTLRNSSFTRIGLFGSAPQGNSTAGLDESKLGGDFFITGNTVLAGVCGALKHNSTTEKVTCVGDYQNEAIEIGYARGGLVKGNHLKNYSAGIVVFGGNAETAPNATRWASGFTIEENWVEGVFTGIMPQNAENVDVLRNTVKDCTDTCLDSEGAKNVTFFDNTAMFASNYVFSVFYNSEGTTFNWNRIRKGDHYTDENGVHRAVNHRQLFRTVNYSPTAFRKVAIRIHNNELTWEGAGYATITKEFAGEDDSTPSTNYVLFDNNIVTNAVVSFQIGQGGNGTVQMRGNTFSFTNPVDVPVIDVAGTHLWGNRETRPLNGPWHAEIAGNVITSGPKVQGVPAIRVLQSGGLAVNTLIDRNRVQDFGTSIQVISDLDPGAAHVPRGDHHFAVVNNGHSGSIDTSLAVATAINSNGNYPMANTP